MATKPTCVVFSQVYPPDPTSVGQHMHDAAVEMASRGYRVIVYTASRGYNDPTRRFPRRELLDGVEVRRLPLSSFGKASIVVRLIGGFSFTLQCMARAMFTRNFKLMLVSTSPPMCPLAAVVIGWFRRRVQITFWAMDLNPDQMVEMGKLSEGSLAVRAFDWLNRRILKCSRAVVALDRFMAERINRKLDVGDKMAVLPPWPHEDHIEPVDHDDNPFRQQHGLVDKTVIMYSGNLGPALPVDTVLAAARRVEDLEDLLFLFIGGGSGKQKIDDMVACKKPPNIRVMPYQPIETLRFSLSAADVHLVSIADEMVGICHPCKGYGAMAVSRPILLLGPNPCHVSDLIDGADAGWIIGHGDVDRAEQVLREIHATCHVELMKKGRQARQIIDGQYTKEHLCGKFCDVVENGPEDRAPV